MSATSAPMPPTIFVATLMSGLGQSGVETHANAIVGQSREAGLVARFVSGQFEKDLVRRCFGVLRRVVRCASREWALLIEREADAGLLERKLRRLMSQSPDVPIIVYAQDPLSARAAIRARGARPVRVVMTVHFNESEAVEYEGRGLTRKAGALWRHAAGVEREVLPRVDHLIFVSDFMRERLLKRYPVLAALPSSLIPNFCARPDVAGDRAVAAPSDGELLAIGSLEPRKNQRFLLEVLAACNRLGRRYRCTIVGHGPDADSLQARAVALGVAGQVNFLGHRQKAVELIPSHRVLVHGSLMENMPITLIEALACARPVMAAAVGGIPEVIEDGVQGCLWPLDDPEAAARRLIEVLESPGLWARMSASAKRRYEEHFSTDVLVPRWLTAITGQAPA